MNGPEGECRLFRLNLLPRCLLAVLVGLLAGCRTPRDVYEIEYLTSTRPPYPVLVADLPEPLEGDSRVAPASLEVPVSSLFMLDGTELEPEGLPPRDDGGTAGALPAEGGLSLETLQEWARTYNPTLRQGSLALQAARGRQFQAGLYPNPTLGYLGTEIGNEGQAGQQGGYVAQTIVTGHKLAVNQALASQVVQRQIWRYEAQQVRVFNEVALRHAEALGAQAIARLTEELEQIASQGAEVSRQLFAAQQVGRADVLQAEIQWNQIRVLRQNALATERNARRQLAHAIGMDELPRQSLEGDLEGDRPRGDFESVWQDLFAASPLLLAAQADVDRARWQQRVEQLRPVPNVDLLASVQHDYASDYTVYGAQVGMAIPLFDGNQGNLVAARAEVARAIAERDRLELEMRDRLSEVWQQYEVAWAEVERYRQDIIPRAEENLQLTEEGYRLGEFDFLRVLTARQTYFQTNVEYRRSLVALRQASILLDGLLLSGGLTAPDA
jgi:outer membrane protein, heavy metal efflux system